MCGLLKSVGCEFDCACFRGRLGGDVMLGEEVCADEVAAGAAVNEECCWLVTQCALEFDGRSVRRVRKIGV